MSAPTRTPRKTWIEEGLRALAAGGPEAVRIEPLARNLGVTRGGFYWHFDDRGALLEEILDAWERLSVDEVIEQLERGGGEARAKLRRLSRIAGSGDEPLMLDLAVRSWGRRDPAVAQRLRRVDNRRMEYLRCLFRAFWVSTDLESGLASGREQAKPNRASAAQKGTSTRRTVGRAVGRARLVCFVRAFVRLAPLRSSLGQKWPKSRP